MAYEYDHNCKWTPNSKGLKLRGLFSYIYIYIKNSNFNKSDKS